MGWRYGMSIRGEYRKERSRRRLADGRRWRGRLMRRAALIYPHPCPFDRCRRSMRTWEAVWQRRHEYVSRYYRNRKVCVGDCCRNYRRSAKAMTRQEFRAELDARAQFDEFGLRVKANRFRPRF
jgi:hypothetical protein